MPNQPINHMDRGLQQSSGRSSKREQTVHPGSVPGISPGYGSAAEPGESGRVRCRNNSRQEANCVRGPVLHLLHFIHRCGHGNQASSQHLRCGGRKFKHRIREMMVFAAGLATFFAYFFLMLSMVDIIQIRLGKLSCRGSKALGATVDIATLEELVLEDNQLGGTLHQNLGNLSRTRRLLLSANNFTGTIPDTFSKLKNLTNLHMQGTSMDGPIPSTISQLKNITKLLKLFLSKYYPFEKLK
ncbi:putative LRR receptor-like serine/threonine-protein kinase [Camellia lanceoleosa]|uniref:LRR receptor-like serine/threonine-protein kinase n=1 Tax=Camellia lanceoleosa TaxID=1840588 RepID=A0ACC0F637_9ERIC|nr:putative LRR receptor-like serine/threonine-protein kinase [Camellia lanceoleosa]